MSEQQKITRAEIEEQWNNFQDEVIAHAHDYSSREQVINKHLPDLSYMIEHSDDIRGNHQELVFELGEHVRKLGLEATPTKLPLLYFEEKLQSPQLHYNVEQIEGEGYEGSETAPRPYHYGRGLYRVEEQPSSGPDESPPPERQSHLKWIVFATLIILVLCGIVAYLFLTGH
jgi:hypothetical protein